MRIVWTGLPREPRQEKEVDLSPFTADSGEALALVMDLVPLAKRDGVFHPVEQGFLRRDTERVGCPEQDLQGITS